jgi:hypothetical protein
MGGICDEVSVRVEHGARKIQPFFDVDRVSRILKHSSHIFGNIHEVTVEYLEHYRINIGTKLRMLFPGARGLEDHLTGVIDKQPPVRFDDNGRRLIDNYGRAKD